MIQQWEFYPSYVDGKSASIYVNLAYRDDPSNQEQTDLVWLRLHLQQPNEDGLSSQGEFQTLSDIEDAIENALNECEVPSSYVGRNTSNGQRDFYIYSANGHAIENVLGQAIVSFTEYEFETGHQSDSQWSVYLEFLCPSPRDMQLILNGHVIESLQKRNDKLSVPREVAHWAYFPDRAKRNIFVSKAESLGFVYRQDIDSGPENDGWGAIVVRIDPVDYWSIADAALVLYDLAEKCGGDYDGWEAPVVNDEDDGWVQ